ncbi:DUF2393 family protein [Sulfurimonas sp.]|uniref:DUF2393 family protein n=1 Tax=Sulfurimonas sp. TaxID=2022749 RepID=UPI003564CF9D
MRKNIDAIIDNLIVQDYILFASVFILFIVLMILGVILRAKKNVSRLIVSIAFLILLLGPTLGYIEMHKFLFKNHVELLREQKLEFTKAIVVEGKITNGSEVDFYACKIIATAYRKTPNEYKNYILRLKPIQISSIVIQDIQKNQTKEFKMFIEPFSYSNEYEVGLEASCK